MKHTPYYDHCSHYKVALHPELTELYVQRIKDNLGNQIKEFDAIAFMGNSGALLAPIVALGLDKTLIMVRKSTRGVHSSRLVEGDKGAKTYVIVDDLVDSGKTAKAIVRRVKKWSGAKFLGVIEMNDIYDNTFTRLTYRHYEAFV